MADDFDVAIARGGTDSYKWAHYAPDVLPLWVADMDFAAPAAVIEALRARVDHGIFGYGPERPAFVEVFAERLWQRHRWRVSPEAIVLLPGVLAGAHVAARAVAAPGDGVALQYPLYPPLGRIPPKLGLRTDGMVIEAGADGAYAVDLDRFARAVTASTRMFLLCNPHNPLGRVFTRAELAGMAEACLRHDAVICADEIHGDLVFPGAAHIPVATLGPEIERRTITLMAPTKTYNLPGLNCGLAVIPDRALRERFARAASASGLTRTVSLLAATAALAAYRDGEPWLRRLMAYLTENRRVVLDAARTRLGPVRALAPEGTYLAWLDCRGLNLGAATPYEFFLGRARVALSDGSTFGPGGDGHVRLNFGCPRPRLAEALERMARAVTDRPR